MSGHSDLSWALCIPTINRLEVLKLCVSCALEQTHRPREIAIVDASDDWTAHRDAVSDLIGDLPIRLIYDKAEARSSAVQRNQAAAQVTADVLFFFDDDTLMHPTCAEEVLSVYSADEYQAISSIAARHVADLPPVVNSAGGPRDRSAEIAGKGVFANNKDTLRKIFARSGVLRFVQREILMMAMDRMFVPYDAHRKRADARLPRFLQGSEAYCVRHLPGYAMTVRRQVAEDEPFDPHLLAYCPTEDLEVSYRWGRHGVNLVLPRAWLHHYEVAIGRVTRAQATLLGILNSAFFTRLNSDAPRRHMIDYYVLTARRVFGETFKDLLTGRFSLPQGRGAAEGLVRSVQVFRHPDDGLTEWYMDLQRRMLRK